MDKSIHLDEREKDEATTYTWPGSIWRPSACEADVIATRPRVLHDRWIERLIGIYIARSIIRPKN